MQKVKFLRPHHAFAYNAGDITSITSENVTKLADDYAKEKKWNKNLPEGQYPEPDKGPYVEILPDNYQEPTKEHNEILESTYVRVKWLKAHGAYAYNEGDIGQILIEKAIELVEGDFVELLPEDYKEPVLVREIIPESDKIEVRFIKIHPAFAYNIGDETKLYPAQVDLLLKDGYVQVIPKNEKQKRNTIERLKSIIKKI